MKTLHKNFIFLIALLCNGIIHTGYNLTMQITNNTGFPCNFTDGNNAPIAVAIGQTLTYNFQSGPISYTFGPSVPTYTPSIANGSIYYNANNYLYLSSNSQPYYVNKTGFQLYLTYSNNSTVILNNNGSVAQGVTVTQIGAQPFKSGSISSAPFITTFTLDSTGAVTQSTIDITNNSNDEVTNLVFKTNGGTTTGTASLVPAYSSTNIPKNSTLVSCICNALHSTTATLPVSDSRASYIYGAGSIINTTDQTVYLSPIGQYTDSVAPLYLALQIPLAGKEQQLLLSATVGIDITSTAQKDTGDIVKNKTISSNEIWYLTLTNGVWDLSTTPPTQIPTAITNNTGYTCNLVDLSTNTTVSFANGESKIYTFTTYPISYTFGPDVASIDASSYSEGANIYYNGSSLYLQNKFSPWNNYTPFQVYVIDDIANTTYIINKNSYNSNIQFGSVVGVEPYKSGTVTSIPLTAVFTMNGSTGAIEVNATYQTLLLNNFNKATSTITFTNGSTGGTSSINALSPWSYVQIPAGTTSVYCTGLANGGSFTLDATTASNIYTDSIITNATNASIWLQCTTTTGGNYTIYPGQSLPIVSGVVDVTLFVDSVWKDSTIITPNTSYLITYTNPDYFITPYTPLVQNNYTTDVTNLSFYNSNSQLTSVVDELEANETTATPTTSSYGTFDITFNSTNSTIYVPITFPQEPLGLFTNNTITNSSGFNVKVNYYGDFNNLTDQKLTTTNPISANNTQIIPISTGALNAQILDADGNEVIAKTNGALQPGISYYILYQSGTWVLSPTPAGSTYWLINNSNTPTGTITFYNSSASPVGTTSSIPAYGYYAIPSTAVKATCAGLVNNSTCNIQLPSATNVNIYTNYALTNNTDFSVTATYYGTENSSPILNGTVIIPARNSATNPTFVPIVTSTTSIAAPNINRQTISDSSSYIISFDGTTWSMDAYTPTLHNNSSQNGTNLIFYDSNGVAISSEDSGDFAAAGTATVPIHATSASVYLYDSTITIPTTLAENSYLFSNYTFTNLSDLTVNITFYSDIINGVTPTLNTPGITLQASQAIPRITSATSVYVSSGGVTAIAQESIEDSTSYFINYDAPSNTWWLSTNAPDQGALFTNNYNQNLTNLRFYTSQSTQIGNSYETFDAWESVEIPSNAAQAAFTTFESNVQLYTNPTTSINVYTGYVIHNNTTENIALWFYNKTHNINLNPGIATAPTTSTPLLTYTDTVAVTNTTYVDGNPTITYIQATEINPNSSYYVIYDINASPQWQLVATLPTENAYLINNYDGIATNLAFFNAENDQQGTTQSVMFSHTSSLIPATTVLAKLVYFNTNISMDITSSMSTGIFTNNYIINNAGQNISIIYYGNNQQQLSDPISTLNATNIVPIITSAAYFSILDTQGNPTPIVLEPITANTDYTIDDTWTVTPTIPARLTNNSGQDAANLIFKDITSTPVGNVTNPFYNQTAVDIPLDATTAQTTEVFNNVSSTLTVPISDGNAYNLVTPYQVYNNTVETVALTFYGTLNTVADQPLNNPGISMTAFDIVPITTGAQTASVVFNNVEVITNAEISANTTYFINFINNTWSLDPYAAIANLSNNSSDDATNLTFYDSNNVAIITHANFDAYSSEQIPTTATYASADFAAPFDATLTVPVLGAVDSTVFNTTNSIIVNNTSDPTQHIGLIFYGTLNGVDGVTLNDPTIDMDSNTSIPIVNGPESFSIVDITDNNIVHIANYPIAYNESYSITNQNGIWQVNVDIYAATLANNYNQDGTNLQFFNSTTTFDTTTQVGVTQANFPAFSTPGIPTYSLAAQFDIFDTTLTFPVSDATSSTVYANLLYNKTGTTINVTYYGTLDGINDVALNDSAISCDDGATIPFLSATKYMIITSGSNTLDTRSTSYNPLPLTNAYDIVFNPSLNIIIHQLNLTNNFYQTASSVNFYDINGTFISTTTLQPFATTTVPTNARYAVMTYDDYMITVPLSTTTSSNVLTNNIVTNNANDDLTVLFYDNKGNVLSTEPLLLTTGSAIPFIYGTQSVTIFNNGTPIIANNPIDPTASYRIQQQNNFESRLLRVTTAEVPELQPASSALGVIRVLGGATQATPSVPSVQVYGYNKNLFKEFLYIDVYAKIIADPVARAATSLAVNTIVDQYADNNSSNNFNYVSYLYQINDQLRAAQALLLSQYPSSIQQINLFFRCLLKRNNVTLLA